MKAEKIANNHLRITTNLGTYLQSYDSIVAKIDKNGSITLGKNWNFSATTAKYRTAFLSLTLKELNKKIEANEIKIDNTLKIE